jgi:hypothetical protein
MDRTTRLRGRVESVVFVAGLPEPIGAKQASLGKLMLYQLSYARVDA